MSSVPPSSATAMRMPRVRAAAAAFLWLGGVFVVAGFGLLQPWLICFGTMLAALGLAAIDISEARTGGVSAITVFALVSAFTALANAVGLRTADTPRRYLYFVYAVEEHLLLASLLALAGTVLPVIGFWLVSRRANAWRSFVVLPRIEWEVRDTYLVPAGVILACGVLALRTAYPSFDAGTFTALIDYIPHFVVFALARAGTDRRVRGALLAAVILALAASARGFFFAYLRSEILIPLAAFVFGALLGSRSLEPLKRKAFIPIYVALALFVTYFGTIGQLRGKVSGLEKLEAVREHQQDPLEGPSPEGQTVLSRATNFNQLSQIGRVAEEDGFYGGQTLDYLAFAFIPRVLWPEKPLIQRGSWFAVRIGQGMRTADGWYNNAINMTVQGELYLNFGWIGAIVGSLLFGAFLGVLWTRVRFWEYPQDVLGAAFAFYLVWSLLVLSGDLTIVVTLIAVYLIFAGVSVAHRAYLGRHHRPQRAPILADQW